MKMKKEDINKEIETRVNFKLKDVFSNISTAINRNKVIALDQAFKEDIQTSQKHTHYAEAFEEFKNVFIKEMDMPVPYDNMYEMKQRKKKDEAVEAILSLMPYGQRRYPSNIVSIIEKCMGMQ